MSYEVQSTPTLINDNGTALLNVNDYKLICVDQGWSRTTNSEGDLVLTPSLDAVAACTLQRTFTGLIIGRTYRLLVAVPTANAPTSQSLASITMAGSTIPLWVIAANNPTQGRNATYFNTESPRSGSIGVSGSGIREFYLVFKATANAVTIDYLGAKLNPNTGRVIRNIKLIQEPIYDGYAEEDGYRYGFNGKENLSEIYGEGVLQDYGFRIYNANIARFISVDPLRKKYPSLTTYQFASNIPISGVDLDGLEYYFAADGRLLGKLGTDQSVRVVKEEDVNTVSALIKATEFSLNSQPNQEGPVNSIPFGFTKIMADQLSTEVEGLTFEELNLRATLALLKQTEAGSANEPLDYNHWNENRKFTDKSYEEAPQDYAKHPGVNSKSKNGKRTSAGAYQFMYDVYTSKGIAKGLDFSPTNQDIATVKNMKPLGRAAAKSGNVAEIKARNDGRWTSLKHWSIKNLSALFQKKIADELNGRSKVAAPLGTLSIIKKD